MQVGPHHNNAIWSLRDEPQACQLQDAQEFTHCYSCTPPARCLPACQLTWQRLFRTEHQAQLREPAAAAQLPCRPAAAQPLGAAQACGQRPIPPGSHPAAHALRLHPAHLRPAGAAGALRVRQRQRRHRAPLCLCPDLPSRLRAHTCPSQAPSHHSTAAGISRAASCRLTHQHQASSARRHAAGACVPAETLWAGLQGAAACGRRPARRSPVLQPQL